ncbi:MAG: hypothetical protein KAJ40_03095 [Alphaproteobacteria bacterium]|nr:hypothetical protein [Alphaproteobacteria bacterium]
MSDGSIQAPRPHFIGYLLPPFGVHGLWYGGATALSHDTVTINILCDSDVLTANFEIYYYDMEGNFVSQIQPIIGSGEIDIHNVGPGGFYISAYSTSYSGANLLLQSDDIPIWMDIELSDGEELPGYPYPLSIFIDDLQELTNSYVESTKIAITDFAQGVAEFNQALRDFFVATGESVEEATEHAASVIAEEGVGLFDNYLWAWENPDAVLGELADWLQGVIDLIGTTLFPRSPLVLDLGAEGIDLSSTVYWDIDQDGMAEATSWVGPEDGLLAYDRNSNGTIDNHSELFGTEVDDGFLMLAEFDTNGDRIIDAVNDNTMGSGKYKIAA